VQKTYSSVALLAEEGEPALGTEEKSEGLRRVQVVGPTTRQERLASMDILRGIALMGILASNISDFSGQNLTGVVHSLPRQTLSGWHSHLNLAVYFLQYIFFHGKTRGLLSMLFGAGVILLTTRMERRAGAKAASTTFLRRSCWMIVVGLLHAYFIWDGDYIMPYAGTALLFVFACRGLRPKTLLIAGVLITVIPGTYVYLAAIKQLPTLGLAERHLVAERDARAGKTPTEAQRADQQAWNVMMQPLTYDPQKEAASIREGQQGYLAQLKQSPVEFLKGELISLAIAVVESGGMMLIGMALFKLGFFTGELSSATYVWTMSLGVLASLPLTLAGLLKAKASGFAPGVVACWMNLPHEFTRIGATLATAAFIILLVKTGAFRGVARRCAAVGQTALTNYILTSVICQFLFAWGPWKLYGRLEFFQIYYCVFGVWFLNLAVSPIWLRYFAFGPLEWVLRSLTYWKRQPMLLRS
jgi:uncharacterized protein